MAPTNTIINLRLEQYPALMIGLKNLSAKVISMPSDTEEEKKAKEKAEIDYVGKMRDLARNDLFFLIRYLMNRPDMHHQWLLERCQEIQASPDGHLDLWSREHYKSTIITFGKTIQDILSSHGDDPDPKWHGKQIVIGIFSHTRPIAKAFLKQISRELETNQTLKDLFPDVLYQEPQREAPVWSADAGIIVKRTSNPKESTIEAWGVVEGQPTSKHFDILIYDDMVTKESVGNADMIKKTTESWELSLNLGAGENVKKRYIGTRYHLNDSYKVMMDRGSAKVRLYPATDNGEMDGTPVFWSLEHFREKCRDMGTFTAACQLLQNPLADKSKGFKRKDLRFFDRMGSKGGRANRIILVDPANQKKKKSDYTAMACLELGMDHNFYAVDILRDKLNLHERTEALIHMHRNWHNSTGKVQTVAYEQYGKDSDIQHIEYVQAEENYRFDITPVGGPQNKTDRILRLQPIIEDHRFWLPKQLMYRQVWDGRTVDIVDNFLLEEFDTFPVPIHDDMLDMFARVCDIPLVWPKLLEPEKKSGYSSRSSNNYAMGG